MPSQDHDEEEARLLARVGRRIGELREHAGLTQANIAEAIGTTVSNYQRIEHGLQNVTVLTMARIARAIGAEPGDFFAPPQQAKRGRGRPSKRRADR